MFVSYFANNMSPLHTLHNSTIQKGFYAPPLYSIPSFSSSSLS